MKSLHVESENEVLEVDSSTGEILVTTSISDYEKVKMTKIKALSLLNARDFVKINGTWEAKRDGLMKILSSLPISYMWEIKEKVLDMDREYAQIVGVLTVKNGGIERRADGMGICELKELKGQGGLHFMNARAETGALKRAIETLFGSVINYFVINHMEAA